MLSFKGEGWWTGWLCCLLGVGLDLFIWLGTGLGRVLFICCYVLLFGEGFCSDLIWLNWLFVQRSLKIVFHRRIPHGIAIFSCIWGCSYWMTGSQMCMCMSSKMEFIWDADTEWDDCSSKQVSAQLMGGREGWEWRHATPPPLLPKPILHPSFLSIRSRLLRDGDMSFLLHSYSFSVCQIGRPCSVGRCSLLHTTTPPFQRIWLMWMMWECKEVPGAVNSTSQTGGYGACFQRSECPPF